MKKKLFELIAGKVWQGQHGKPDASVIGDIDAIVKAFLPSGSGFDNGTHFVPEKSNPDKLVFSADFHHMNENGYYDGWTHHFVIIRPSLVYGFDLTVTGRNRREIKDYIAETYSDALRREIDVSFDLEGNSFTYIDSYGTSANYCR
ncbi:MAG: hypothetical protein WC829_02050 [Hyphomicrobium sp.]|jgi:hypothetical protein